LFTTYFDFNYHQPPVSGIGQTYEIQFIEKLFFLQEKNLIYAALANNIRLVARQRRESRRAERKISARSIP
jgi:hypothetical protein